jgi:hypothetical protein
MKRIITHAKHLALAVCLTQLPTLLLADDAQQAVDPEAAAQAIWREQIRQIEPPDHGCFHASYPNLNWEQDECHTATPRAHPMRAKPTGEEPAVVGNGNDFVAYTDTLLRGVNGSFSASGVAWEQTVGGDNSVDGSNEYTLQINTNDKMYTYACGSNNGCTVWQQFVYATDYNTQGWASLFMSYWLLGYGNNCPNGWQQSGNDCWINTELHEIPDIAITQLSGMQLHAMAAAGGNDEVMFCFGGVCWAVSASDSVLDISHVWNKAEFNVFGDCGGSQAEFNGGTSITVHLTMTDESTSAPTCLPNAGTTGETNNLYLVKGSCKTAGGTEPSMTFLESN